MEASGFRRRSAFLLLLGVALLAVALLMPATARAGGPLLWTGPTFTTANAAANLDQWGNLPPAAWQNGNLGQSSSKYYEGDSIPYRLKLTDLATGPGHTVTIEWDTTKSGKHALDYLTSYDRTEHPDLCVDAGFSCDGLATDTADIPLDPDVPNMPAGGKLTLVGGTITSVSAYTLTGSYSGDSSRSVTITFTVDSPNLVLGWGGHISTRKDWGPDNSAVAISGSPYHMRLLDLDGSGGNQDRSLSVDAVVFPASITIVKDAVPNDPQDFAFTTTGGLNPATFTLDDDSDPTLPDTQLYPGLEVTAQNGNNYTISEAVPLVWVLSFESPVCTVTSPNGGSQATSGSTLTINLREGENVSCTFTNTRAYTAVVFRSMTAKRTASGALVRWRTASEADTLGFYVYRAVNEKRVRVTPTLVRATRAVSGGTYSYVDRRAPKAKTLRYWIQAVAADGSRTWYGPARVAPRR